jgi:hypothetical protein
MIQRIQTVHLLIAASLVGLFLGLGGTWLAGLADRMAWLPVAAYVLAGLTAALALAAVFFYKQRATQMRVVLAAQVADVALVLVLAGALALSSFGGAATAEGLVQASVALLPVLAYIFLSLARWGVRRDVELVRSMDRLR